MHYLNRNIRYRCEEEYILICDCRNLMDYELPLCYWPLLEALQKGYDEINPMGLMNEKELIEDFVKMGIISNKPGDISILNTDVWSILIYSENEFMIK